MRRSDTPAPPTGRDGDLAPLPWSGRAHFVVLDADFGSGERFLAILRRWRADPERPLRLHYLAPGADPAGAQAMAPALRAAWPPAVPGFHRIMFDDGRVNLDLMFGAPEFCLAQIDARVDAFYVGAALRSPMVLARLALPGATLVAGAAQAPLLGAAGFACQVVPGATHVHAVFAARMPPPPRSQRQERHAIVIGAGLAGAAACERLAARGWHLTLIERHARPAQGASGNRAGIFVPQLSKDDNRAARLSRAAFLFALRQWQNIGGVGRAFAGAACGVLQLARDADHAQVQRQIAAAGHYPPQYATWLEADAAAAVLGAAVSHGGWLFGQGGWAHPAELCQAMLAACGAQLECKFSSDVAALVRVDGQWQAHGADGAIVARAPTLILANGSGATAMAQASTLPLAAVRGQVTYLAAGTFPPLPLVLCREAYMTPPSDGMLSIGATYDADGSAILSAASQRENLEKIASMLGQAPPKHAPLLGRVGFRCVAPDRLPLIGALPEQVLTERAQGGPIERLRDVPRQPGLYGLLAYASRGLIWAPLAAELLAAQIENEPLPLESALVAALDPARFLLKQHRRAHFHKAT